MLASLDLKGHRVVWVGYHKSPEEARFESNPWLSPGSAGCCGEEEWHKINRRQFDNEKDRIMINFFIIMQN